MKNVIILMSTLLISLCTVNNTQKNISYKPVRKYFLKNTYDNKDFTEKIMSSQDEFERLLGGATTMGTDGKPTPIGFSKENVLTLICPKTNLDVKTYKVLKGALNGLYDYSQHNYYHSKTRFKKNNFS